MMECKSRFLALTVTALFFFVLGKGAIKAQEGNDPAARKLERSISELELPSDWMKAWSDPPAELRPLQIAHGIPAQRANLDGTKMLKEMGLGGVVCNVDFKDYMVSDAHWETLVKAVEACRQTGLIVWLYDEDGYPSGAAGGLVLKRNPDFEAFALTFDPSRPELFALRPSYEFTHASNNYYAARRYPNLIDEKAMQCFIDITHQAYWDRLKDYFGSTIKAFFTDEPSLMAVNIGEIPSDVKARVRVVDPLEADIKPLPSVPWVRDLPEQYRRRYGQDIMQVRRSLFEGNGESDRCVRRQFWELISELIAERYFGQIRQWTRAHGVASSGHSLWEEMPLHHVPLEGNALKVLMQMDIPGLDMLSSDPQTVIHSGWLTATLPASAALFNGGRKVMTEVSDFSQTMGGKGPASLAEMRATAAWQAALGVTEFTLYYNYGQRDKQTYKGYCDYVGRLNAFLREAKPAPAVLLYYPIYDLWAEYLPVAEKLTLETQSEKTRQIVESFLKLGRQMLRRQISFALVDHELLAQAEMRDKSIWIGGRRFEALVLPAFVELPASTASVVERFKAIGGKVLFDKPSGQEMDYDSLSRIYENGRLAKFNDRIVVGRFTRNGRDILVVVNVATESYAGDISVGHDKRWLVAYPDNGKIESIKTENSNKIALSLPPRGVVLLISGPQ
ncbi:MAG: hypothetical protein JXM79_00755 [Sedimentisphaerales bacterium]|nr:hypothetical protein [Sedimentisphaerales bacterium]